MKKTRNKIIKKSADKTTLANVSFLNGAPYRKLSMLDWVEYSECLPAEGARRLFEDEVDIALVPLAEFLAHGGLEALDYGIAAKGPVESVLLFADCEIENITDVVVDSASKTSVLLLRLYLERISSSQGKKIRFHRMNSRQAVEQTTGTTASLLIGDLRQKPQSRNEIDLSKWWYEETGLPFVFAVWAYKKDQASANGLDSKRLEEFTASCDRGLELRNQFAQDWAAENQLDPTHAMQYVNKRIRYKLSEDEKRGWQKFSNRVSALNLVPVSSANRSSTKSSIDTILSDSSSGSRISIDDAIRLASTASLADISLAANLRRESLHKDNSVSYIIDRNINYTNVCNVYCRFCAFYRAPGKDGGYVLSKEQIGKKIQETVDAGGIQILLQGGLNPELGIEYYEDLFTWIKKNYRINLHALSSDEILHISEISNISIEETLRRLIQAGLGSLPGGGAELLVNRVRARIAGLKCDAESWLNVHRCAHRLGITSTCTMMFGVGELWEDRILHLHKLRELQDETAGFTAFITWPFQEENTKLKASDTSAPEYLRTQAIARLFLDNIANIQSSWVTQGPSIGQIALFYGANDFGSVMFEENVVSAAGTTYRMDANSIEAHISQAGFVPFQRDVHYNRI